MKTKLFLTTIFTLVSNLLFAQQITQTFNFSTDDLHFSQTNGYDIVNISNTNFLEGEGFAGQPQLPIKSFNLLLPQGAEATDVVINYNPNDLEVISGSYYLYPIQLPAFADGLELLASIKPNIYHTHLTKHSLHLLLYFITL